MGARAAFMHGFLDEIVKLAKEKQEKKDMPSFTRQDRPKKVKDIYRSLKEKHPEMPAEVKARISAKFGKPGVQHPGGKPKGPIHHKYIPKSQGGPRWEKE